MDGNIRRDGKDNKTTTKPQEVTENRTAARLKKQTTKAEHGNEGTDGSMGLRQYEAKSNHAKSFGNLIMGIDNMTKKQSK